MVGDGDDAGVGCFWTKIRRRRQGIYIIGNGVLVRKMGCQDQAVFTNLL